MNPLLLALALSVGASPAPLLDGRPKHIVVVGYSSSRAWPDLLQELLDAHAGTEGLYRVHNASRPGAALVRWLEGTSGRRPSPMEQMVDRYFSGEERPTVALCQQTLQWVFGPRYEGVTGPDDAERIRRGAEAFAELARRLQELGIERVYIATHIYKHHHEPVIGNERLALEALLARGLPGVVRGPDQWSATQPLYPDGYQADGAHPAEAASRVMAVGWYRTLAGTDAREELVERFLLPKGAR